MLSENGWSPRTIVDFSPAFFSLQEHVQKRICSKATKKVTKRVLPKAEAPKQALPKEEAIKKFLPKATEAIRKVLSKASHNYKW